jgi:hypothetical protein
MDDDTSMVSSSMLSILGDRRKMNPTRLQKPQPVLENSTRARKLDPSSKTRPVFKNLIRARKHNPSSKT